MTTTLLVLLVGELLTPFQADFRQALPQAFPEGVPEVGVGPTAPPGRTVAWVTVQPDGLQVEVVLHTARIAGDLRRVLRFTGDDAPRDRAKAAAFTLAAMVRERDADLRALEPPAPPPPPPSVSATPWLLDASGFAGLDVAGLHGGGGLALHLRRELGARVSLGVGLEAGAFAAPASVLALPALYVELLVPVIKGPFSLAAGVGGGVAAPVLIRGATNLTTWQPLLRLNVEGRVALGEHHGLRVGLSAHLVPSRLDVQVGERLAGSVGPAWIRPEIGYFAEL